MRPIRRARDYAAAAHALASWPVFSRTSYVMLKSLRRQDVKVQTVLDAGANRGQFAVAARYMFRPLAIHVFEPLPQSVTRLGALARRYPEVVVHPVALGAEPGEATLHINAHHQSSSLLKVNDRHLRAFPRATEVAAVPVPVRRLDQLLAPADLVSPVLLKIDTQGYELQVLEGAAGILKLVDMLLIETSFVSLYEGEQPFLELLAKLKTLDFDFLRPVGSLIDPNTGEFLQIDGLFRRRRY